MASASKEDLLLLVADDASACSSPNSVFRVSEINNTKRVSEVYSIKLVQKLNMRVMYGMAWRARHFELKGYTLSWRDRTACGSLDVRGALVHDDRLQLARGAARCFRVAVNPVRNPAAPLLELILQADTEEVRSRWKQALQRASATGTHRTDHSLLPVQSLHVSLASTPPPSSLTCS